MLYQRLHVVHHRLQVAVPYVDAYDDPALGIIARDFGGAAGILDGRQLPHGYLSAIGQIYVDVLQIGDVLPKVGLQAYHQVKAPFALEDTAGGEARELDRDQTVKVVYTHSVTGQLATVVRHTHLRKAGYLFYRNVHRSRHVLDQALHFLRLTVQHV